MHRIIILGASGSGKTTFAKKLSHIVTIPHYELDAFFWQKGWHPSPPECFQKHLATILQNKNWIIEGHDIRARDQTWKLAETAIWLDLPLWQVLAQTLKRSLVRIYRHEQLWNENQESLRRAFCSRDSILFWTLKTYFSCKQNYETLLPNHSHPNLKILRLKSRLKVEKFLQEIASLHISNEKR